jgi:hypothetical protein
MRTQTVGRLIRSLEVTEPLLLALTMFLVSATPDARAEVHGAGVTSGPDRIAFVHATVIPMDKVYSFLDEESYDAIVATAKELGMDVIGHIPFSLSVEYVLDAGQMLIAHSEELAKHVGGDYRPERVEELASLVAERGVWLIPTLITTESILEAFDDPQPAVPAADRKRPR